MGPDTPNDSNSEENKEQKPLRLRLNRKDEAPADQAPSDSPKDDQSEPGEQPEKSQPEPDPEPENQSTQSAGSDDEGGKKPVRLSLKRTSPPTEPEPEADSGPEQADEPEDANIDTEGAIAETPKRDSSPPPPRMRLTKKPTPDDDSPEAKTPTNAETPPAMDSPFGDEDLEDFAGPEIADDTSTPPEKEPRSEENEDDAKREPPPQRFKLKPRENEEDAPVENEPEPEPESRQEAPETPVPAPSDKTETDSGEEEGWDGTPESQLTSTPVQPSKDKPGGEEESSQSKSGLKLKTKGPDSGKDKVPEGMSHGTLTPFEREKAVTGSKPQSGDTPPPLPKKKKKKDKGDQKPTTSSSETTDHSKAGKLVLTIGLIFILALLGIGIAMVMRIGPFAPPPEDPTPPIAQDTPKPTSDDAPDTGEPDGPVTQTTRNIEAANRNNDQVDAIVDDTDTDDSETTTPEDSPDSDSENEQIVVKVSEDSSEQTEGGDSDAPMETPSDSTKPLEEEEQSDTPTQNPEIVTWVENMNISGANESRQIIIFNNTRYERNQFVDFQRGIQFLGIKGRIIYFRDTNDAIYKKEF